MANIKYFSDWNGQTIQLPYLSTISNAEFARMFPGIKGRRCDSFSRYVCKIAGVLLPVTRSIEFKRNPSLHKCDARCQSAKGHQCECSCGGANHGSQS